MRNVCLLVLICLSVSWAIAQSDESLQITPETAADVTLLAELPLRGANTVAWSSTGRLAIGTMDGAVDVYDPRDPRAMLVPVFSFQVAARENADPNQNDMSGSFAVMGLAFSPDGNSLAVAGMSGVEIWNLTNRSRRILANAGGQMGLAYSPDGTVLATFDSNGQVNTWSLVAWSQLVTLPETIDQPTGIGFSPDGSRLVVSSGAGDVYVFLVESGRGVWWEHADLPEGLSSGGGGGGDFPSWARDTARFSADGRLLVNGSSFSTARLWSVESGAVLTALAQPHDDGLIDMNARSAAFTLDGSLLAVAGGRLVGVTRGVYLFSVAAALRENGEPNLYGEPTASTTLRFLPHRGVDSIAFNADDTRLISVGRDLARLWALPDARPTQAELIALSDMNFVAYCAQLGQTPLKPTTDQRIGIVWSWFAVTPEQLNSHIDHALYDVHLDSADDSLARWRFLAQTGRDPINSNHYTVYYYTPIGRLDSGEHTIEYEVEWGQPITDGFEQFGPGTQNVSDAGSCGIEVVE